MYILHPEENAFHKSGNTAEFNYATNFDFDVSCCLCQLGVNKKLKRCFKRPCYDIQAF